MASTRHLLPAAGLAVLAAIGLAVASSSAVAQNPNSGTAPVSIVNPLPLPVSGAIGLAPGSSLTIANGADNPVLVRDVDERPAYQPFRTRFSVGFSIGESADLVSGYTVPAGKRLVVEDASARAFLPPGQVAEVSLAVLVSGGVFYNRRLPLIFARRTPGISQSDVLVGGDMVRLYLAAGESLGATGGRSSEEATGSIDVQVTGYLIDVP